MCCICCKMVASCTNPPTPEGAEVMAHTWLVLLIGMVAANATNCL